MRGLDNYNKERLLDKRKRALEAREKELFTLLKIEVCSCLW